jgi:hypothetical protein
MSADRELSPRDAEEIPEWEIEMMIKDAIKQVLRADIAERALAWVACDKLGQ